MAARGTTIKDGPGDTTTRAGKSKTFFQNHYKEVKITYIISPARQKCFYWKRNDSLVVDWYSKRGVYQLRSRGASRQPSSIIGWAKMLPGWVVLLLPVLNCSGTTLSHVGTPLQTDPLTLQPDTNLFHWTSTTLAIAPEEVLLPKMLQKMWVGKPSYRPKVKIF